MTARSQNGWLANRPDLLTVIEPVRGRRFRVRAGPVAVVFEAFIAAFHARVEPITSGQLDDWSYAPRRVRGGRALSNHASGTAVDLNATAHPLGVMGTFSGPQVRALRALLAAFPVLRWGGDYRGRPDEMHFEINADHGPVAALADALTRQPDPEDEMPTAAEIRAIIREEIAAAAPRLAAAVWQRPTTARDGTVVTAAAALRRADDVLTEGGIRAAVRAELDNREVTP